MTPGKLSVKGPLLLPKASPVQISVSPELNEPAVAGQLPCVTKAVPPPDPAKLPEMAHAGDPFAEKLAGMAVPSAPSCAQFTESLLAKGLVTTTIPAKAGAQAKRHPAIRTLEVKVIE
jgi:hypothetical protein